MNDGTIYMSIPPLMNFVPITVAEAILWIRALNTCVKSQMWYDVVEIEGEVVFFMMN